LANSKGTPRGFEKIKKGGEDVYGPTHVKYVPAGKTRTKITEEKNHTQKGGDWLSQMAEGGWLAGTRPRRCNESGQLQKCKRRGRRGNREKRTPPVGSQNRTKQDTQKTPSTNGENPHHTTKTIYFPSISKNLVWGEGAGKSRSENGPGVPAKSSTCHPIKVGQLRQF